MAAAPSFLLLLILLGAEPGGVLDDVVSWLSPELYFQSRKIEVNADHLERLADTPPTDGKSSLQQLLAIRWLGEHPAEAKKAKHVRAVLEELASGKRGDSQGFAKAYAQRALALLDGKAPAGRTMPADSLQEALSWFPEAARMFGAADLRTPSAGNPTTALRDLFHRNMRDESWEAIYSFVEAVGNVRIERVAIAYVPDAQKPSSGKLYLRCTGVADRARLAAYFKNSAGATVETEKGPKGEPITFVSFRGRDPALALIGDHDLILAGHARGTDGDNLDVVKESLKVRSAGKGSVVTGSLSEMLKRVPAAASALAVGDLPEEFRKEFTSRGSPFSVFPQKLLAFKTLDKGADLQWQGSFDKPEDAKTFTENVAKLKQQGLDALKNIPAEAKIKKETVELLRKTLEGLKTEADGKSVKGSAQVTPEAGRAVLEVLERLLLAREPDLGRWSRKRFMRVATGSVPGGSHPASW